MKGSPRGVRTIGLGILSAIVLISVMAPWIATHDPKATDYIPFQPPGGIHYLGTDNVGRDLFSQLLYASRVSLLVGFVASTVTITIGVLVGLIAGYFRGIVEDVLLGVTDAFIILPGLPLIVLFSVYIGPGIVTLILVITLLWWCGTARVVHSRVIQVREMSFIESTRALGFRSIYIIFRHILKNTWDIIVARWALAAASAMMAEAGMAFLGLGDPFRISWGGMISRAFSYGGFAQDLWWWYVSPGCMICVTALAFFLLATRDQKVFTSLEML